LLAIKKVENKSREAAEVDVMHVCVDKDPDISRYTVRKRGKSIHQESSAIDKGLPSI
jgi:hypothetical protein